MVSIREDVIRPIAIQYLVARDWMKSRVTYNPLAGHMHDDPYPHYAKLREKDPMHWSHLSRSWVFTRFDDIDAILRDGKRFSSADRPDERMPHDNPFADEPASMLFSDPPDHTRLRGLVSQAFTPRAITEMEPRIAEIVDELLGDIEDGATVDLIEVLAYPLPVIVISEMLGIPAEDRTQFRAWSHIVARTLEPTISRDELREAGVAATELGEYLQGLIRERRDQPGEDLMSLLIAAEEAGDQLSEAELLVTMRLLLVAGNETTTNLIANGLLALLRHPDQLRRLRDNPELMESAVEELLRFDSPVQTDGRRAVEDVTFGEGVVRSGQRVVLLLGAANHDPDQFSEPDELDLGREDNPHIAFGRGLHHCLGAPLARVEGRIAFRGLLDRFAEIQLAVEKPRFKDHVVLRGLESLPVTLRR